MNGCARSFGEDVHLPADVVLTHAVRCARRTQKPSVTVACGGTLQANTLGSGVLNSEININ